MLREPTVEIKIEAYFNVRQVSHDTGFLQGIRRYGNMRFLLEE